MGLVCAIKLSETWPHQPYERGAPAIVLTHGGGVEASEGHVPRLWLRAFPILVEGTMDVAVKTRKAPTYQTVPYDHMVVACTKLAEDAASLVQRIGYSRTAAGEWAKRGGHGHRRAGGRQRAP